jgi:hypothetical protein
MDLQKCSFWPKWMKNRPKSEKGPLPDKDFETHFAVGGMESMAAFATTAPIPAFRFVKELM